MQVRHIPIQVSQHIFWSAENVSGYQELHVAERGSRLATVTDVVWLSDDYLLAAHHAARRISLFDLASPQAAILTIEIPFRVDALAVQPPQGDLIEILASGTWKAHYAVVHLSRNIDTGDVHLHFRGSCMQPLRQPPSFSHGVFYLGGEPGVCYNAGESPRIDIGHGQKILTLPDGWFPTNACWSSAEQVLYVVANGHQPKPSRFQGARASVWKSTPDFRSLVQLADLPSAHFDSCILGADRLWVNDQYGDRVLGMKLTDPSNFVSLEAPEINFPHGISLSPGGRLAVANYKTSSISIFDLPTNV